MINWITQRFDIKCRGKVPLKLKRGFRFTLQVDDIIRFWFFFRKEKCQEIQYITHWQFNAGRTKRNISFFFSSQ